MHLIDRHNILAFSNVKSLVQIKPLVYISWLEELPGQLPGLLKQ